MATQLKQRRTRPIMVVAVVVAALIAFWLVSDGEDSAKPPAITPGERAVLGAEPAPSTAASAESDQAIEALARRPLPESLRGTEIDGGLTVDADGNFVPTPDAIALFDFFLAARSEESEAVIRARIVALIRSRLDGDAMTDAVALLDSYLGFRDELRELAGASEAPSEPEQRLQWIRELRRKHFGEALAESLFGESEAVARIDFARRRVALDSSLEPEERRERLDALDEQLPESVRAARRSGPSPQRAQDEVEALRQAGGSDAEIFALRERRFGREAAERLAGFDAARESWEERLEIYQGERDQLLSREYVSELSADEREGALESIRREHFDGYELERVRALDRLAP
ncbi:MAG: lipase chaperone [Deltaproteobacteria bacterium]|nr:lipase chaperone [Deltaproteobacteria bacterium]